MKEEEERRKEAERKKKEEEEARVEQLRRQEDERRRVSSCCQVFCFVVFCYVRWYVVCICDVWLSVVCCLVDKLSQKHVASNWVSGGLFFLALTWHINFARQMVSRS